MAYIKTNWINGVTPMDDINLNKIEAGIFNTEVQMSAFPISGTDGTTSWVKFADGTMIQWLRLTSTTIAIATVYSTVFTGAYTWTFPVAFYYTPVVTCSEFKYGTSASIGSVSGVPALTSVGLRVTDWFSRATGTATTIGAMAIGRWKA